MRQNDFMSQMGITLGQLEVVSQCMMTNNSLSETSVTADIHCPKKTYAIANWVAKQDFGLPLDDLAPKFVIERVDLQQFESTTDIQNTKLQNKVLGGILTDLRFLVTEMTQLRAVNG
ncbi:hypothetical protein AB6D11_02855 [Vibrio splendidus]